MSVIKVPSYHHHTVGSWFPTGYYGHYRSRARTDFINEYRQLAKPQPPKRFIQRSSFPTGYYGHYRSRARTDFINEYRQLAKPQPPKRFIQRSSQPTPFHVFSMHDNRNSFQYDASYFAQGLGRKRHPERSGVFDPNILSWPAYRANPNIDRPLTSTYKKDFNMGEPNVQMLVKRPLTSFDGVPTTMYRTVHGTDSPNHNLINVLNNEALMMSSKRQLYQARKKVDRRETVASCLSWYRPHVPQTTCHTDYSMDAQLSQETGIKNNNNTTTSVSSAAHESAPVVSISESTLPVSVSSE